MGGGIVHERDHVEDKCLNKLLRPRPGAESALDGVTLQTLARFAELSLPWT
jgi:hypothetical protein